MNILFITPYPIKGPSSRFRVWQYVPKLRALGHDVRVAPFFTSAGYAGFYRPGAWMWKTAVLAAGFCRRLTLLPEVRRADVVVIHRAAAPVGPALLERLYRRINGHLVYDFDDAIFIGQTSSPHRRLAFLKSPDKTRTLVKLSRRVFAGNRFLAQYAEQSQADVRVVPTVVDLPRLGKKGRARGPVVVGWIGSPTTAPFLEEVSEALAQVKARYGGGVEIRIVGAGEYRLKDLEAVYRPWSLDAELEELQSFDIGLMPLPDTVWARGKCGLKALQYMSVGIPVVCSPIGVNPQIVEDGVSGYLARDTATWSAAISRLVDVADLRRRMGASGRQRVARQYSLEVWAPRFEALLKEVVARREPVEQGRPFRVLRVLTRMNIGGPAIHAVLLTAGLNGPRFRSRLVAGNVTAEEGNMSYLVEQHHIRPTWVPELGRSIRLGDDVVAFWKIYRLIRQERPDILHSHMAKAGAIARVAGRLAGVPVRVHTYHGHLFSGYFDSVRTRLVVFIERLLSRLSTATVAVSPKVKEELTHFFGATGGRNIKVLSLGFDLKPFQVVERRDANLRHRLRLGGENPLVGIVGRMAPVKNHALFLDAASRIHRARPEVHFVLVGGGQLEGELRRRAGELDCRDNVHFVGWERRMERVYPDMDILVLTSKNEGTPVVLIEAMACGVPVVAPRVGGVPDVVEHDSTGMLVPANDAGLLSAAVLDLLGDPRKAASLARNAREYVRRQFSLERLIADTEEWYGGLLDKSAAGAGALVARWPVPEAGRRRRGN